MKTLKFIVVGVVFGIIMYKSEAVSWFRIHEMFRFESFHMYGIIGSALAVGIVFTQWIKRTDKKDMYGQPIVFTDKEKGFLRYLFGGSLFGLGWALTGACPGPMYVLLGSGLMSIGVVLFGAVFGTFVYGVVKDKLPH